MPWLSETTKDVVSCEKLWGVANERRSIDVRMGQPCTLKMCNPTARREKTRRTETSKYPEEKKITMISQVVASERERA